MGEFEMLQKDVEYYKNAFTYTLAALFKANWIEGVKVIIKLAEAREKC